MFRHPLVARPLIESVIAGLLLSVAHNDRDRLLTRPPATPHPKVRAAVELIESSPHEPWTANTLATSVGCGLRSLQIAFKRDLDTTMMHYLEQVRLNCVRDELQRASPTSVTVASIAFTWGFGHLGRFAHRYRQTFGEPPSETLRRQR